MTPVQSWAKQLSTFLGALVGTPVVIALLSHQITPAQAAPGVVAALIGLAWPAMHLDKADEAPVAAAASSVTEDVVKLVPLIVTAYEHGKAALPVAPIPATSSQPVT